MTAQYESLAALSRDDWRRLLSSLLRAELRRRHGASGALAPWPMTWPEETPLDDPTLGLDSLGLIATCSRIASFLQLGASGLDDYLVVARRLGDWVDLLHGAADRITMLEFETSGSTGTPKRVRHRVAALWQEAAIPELLPGDGAALGTVPTCHAYGFIFCVLAPRLTERPIVDVSPAAVAPRLAQEADVDTVIATPPLLQDQRLVERLNQPGTATRLHLVSSGSALGQHHWQPLTAAGHRAVIDVYGATETLGIGWRRGDGYFELLPHRRWATDSGTKVLAIDGTELPVQDTLIRNGARFDLGARLDGQINRAGHLIDLHRVRRELTVAANAASLDCDLVSLDGGAELLLRIKAPEEAVPEDTHARVRSLLHALPPEARPTRIEYS